MSLFEFTVNSFFYFFLGIAYLPGNSLGKDFRIDFKEVLGFSSYYNVNGLEK